MAKTTEVRVHLGEGGRVVIPARFRQALGIQTGDELILRLRDGEIRLSTRREAIRNAQEIVRRHVPSGRSLVDELIRERREEGLRESARGQSR